MKIYSARKWVRSIRSFLKAMDEATRNLPQNLDKKNLQLVVGKLVENELLKPYQRLNKINNFKLHLYGIPSPYWGQEQIVTGLIYRTGPHQRTAGKRIRR